MSSCSLRHRPIRNTSGLPLTASSPLQPTHQPCGIHLVLALVKPSAFILATSAIINLRIEDLDTSVAPSFLQMQDALTTSTRPIFGPGRYQQTSQTQITRTAQTSMFARVSCYPPLGQVTCPKRIQKAIESEQDDTVGPCRTKN